eukprot:1311684-Amphidinium_carterae.1
MTLCGMHCALPRKALTCTSHQSSFDSAENCGAKASTLGWWEEDIAMDERMEIPACRYDVPANKPIMREGKGLQPSDKIVMHQY